VAHEPSRFVGDFQRPVDLVRGDALLAAAHEIEGLQPDVHRRMAGLEDGPHADDVRLPASVTHIESRAVALAQQPADPARLVAMMADKIVCSQFRFNISEGGFFGLKVFGEWRGLHAENPLRRMLAFYLGM
jgi:hypothetical protein